jgi:hypothetical protein
MKQTPTPDQIRRAVLGLAPFALNLNRRRRDLSSLRVAIWQAATIAAICWAFTASILLALLFWATA